MRVLVACDKFKDSLSAAEACNVIADALRRNDPAVIVDVCPITDGGDGFTDVLTRSAAGTVEQHAVRGPRGGAIEAPIGVIAAGNLPANVRTHLDVGTEERVAILAMADASGLALLPPAERDVWQTDTRGTGELLRRAADAGASAIVLGIGGSATNDLGLGALLSVGLELRDGQGSALSAQPANWTKVARLAGVIATLPPVFIACDVTNPLLGPNGAAAIYGPQKGLHRDEVAKLDHAAARMALLLCSHCGKPDTLMDEPGAGAAGGLGFGLRVAVNATLVPGFDFVARWLDLDARIAAADVVLTGEGRFDETSRSGKGPAGIVERALAAGKPVHVFAGAVSGTTLNVPRFAAHAITPAGMPLGQALRDARQNLAGAVEQVFRRAR
jgi:glycerate kinase